MQRSVRPPYRNALRIGSTPSGHLKVQWTGIPENKKRLVLVAHIDREGFLIRRISGEESCEGWQSSYQFKGNTDFKALNSDILLSFKDGTYAGKIAENNGGKEIKFQINKKKSSGIQELLTVA
jgi:hypothetical protein